MPLEFLSAVHTLAATSSSQGLMGTQSHNNAHVCRQGVIQPSGLCVWTRIRMIFFLVFLYQAAWQHTQAEIRGSFVYCSDCHMLSCRLNCAPPPSSSSPVEVLVYSMTTFKDLS